MHYRQLPRTLLIAIVAGLLVAMLAACGGSPTTTHPTQPAPTATPRPPTQGDMYLASAPTAHLINYNQPQGGEIVRTVFIQNRVSHAYFNLVATFAGPITTVEADHGYSINALYNYTFCAVEPGGRNITDVLIKLVGPDGNDVEISTKGDWFIAGAVDGRIFTITAPPETPQPNTNRSNLV